MPAQRVTEGRRTEVEGSARAVPGGWMENGWHMREIRIAGSRRQEGHVDVTLDSGEDQEPLGDGGAAMPLRAVRNLVSHGVRYTLGVYWKQRGQAGLAELTEDLSLSLWSLSPNGGGRKCVSVFMGSMASYGQWLGILTGLPLGASGTKRV
eukprot:6084540-Pyramimonas_sp.AAC.1